jgi:hypothetical protein
MRTCTQGSLIAVFALWSLTRPSGSVLAQGGPPGGGGYLSVQHGSVSPLSGTKVIGGTKFPWQLRTGPTIPLYQGFQISGAFSVNGMGVKVNGKSAMVTQDLFYPSKGTWTYSNAADPISVGTGPSIFPLTVQYYDHSGNPIPEERGGTFTIKLQVYKAEAVVVSPYTQDIVNQIPDPNGDTSLTYQDDYNLLVTSSNPTGRPARRIRAHFRVTPPNNPDTGEPMADFYSLRIGICQTVSLYAGGNVKYTRYMPTGGSTGTLSFRYVDPVPWWDGLNSSWPFYGPESQHDGSSYSGFPVGIWANAGTNPLVLDDSPGEAYGPIFNPFGDPFATYLWGIINAAADRRTRDGSPTLYGFEDVLAATSYDCQGIYVPLTGYKSWSVDLSGYLDLVTGNWVGGAVTDDGSAMEIPATERGPANAETYTVFTVD